MLLISDARKLEDREGLKVEGRKRHVIHMPTKKLILLD